MIFIYNYHHVTAGTGTILNDFMHLCRVEDFRAGGNPKASTPAVSHVMIVLTLSWTRGRIYVRTVVPALAVEKRICESRWVYSGILYYSTVKYQVLLMSRLLQ